MSRYHAPCAEASPFNILEDRAQGIRKQHSRNRREQTASVGRDGSSEEDDGWDSDTSDASSSFQSHRKKIDPIVKEDMLKFEESFKGISTRYRLINRIGEGTFSTVYKAEDLLYNEYCNDWDIDSKDAAHWVSPPVKKELSPQDRHRPRYVAIKKIYVTSSPMRIQNELELLNDLRWCKSICPLITAFRHQDQVVADFFRQMLPAEMKVYFRSLFKALFAVHQQGILHRDIKPTNFLYDHYRQRGVLVDFGLAEREGTECSYCLCTDSGNRRKNKIENSYYAAHHPTHGYPKNDTRPSRRANRAGTRGFRAPEVLLKCPSQTTKIDVWSAGVILLTMLSRRFPFFNSADDVDAMIEIASIFGTKRMKACAIIHGSIFECTIPTIGERGYSFEKLIAWAASKNGTGQESFDPGEKQAIAFLGRCMELDPRRRFSAKDALQDPFLADDTVPALEEDEIEIVGQ